jgi:hypothetical protein
MFPWLATGVRATTGGFPPAAGPVGAGSSALEEWPGRGPMASDISLAVGDGARRMTYAEIAEARGISLPSARRLVLRHRWPRQTGNDGIVRVTVPLTALKSRDPVGTTDTMTTHHKRPETAVFGDTTTPDSMSHATDSATPISVGMTDATTAVSVTTTDPLTAIGIQALSQAVEMLREDLAIVNSALVSERERAEQAERRVAELLALLAEGQRQIGGLYGELADARTAAMIAGSEAAALRAQGDERRGWRLLRRLRWALRGE